jgi:hypothetical protein
MATTEEDDVCELGGQAHARIGCKTSARKALSADSRASTHMGMIGTMQLS